ncbi:MAG: ATP-binding protein [Anaerolineales bacterium]
MKPFNNILSFGGKVLITYLLIIAVFVVVFAVAANAALPGSLSRHMGMGGGRGSGPMESSQLENTRVAVNEAFLLAAGVALAVALGFSLWIARQVATPVRDLSRASEDLARGRYDKRVPVKGADEFAQLANSFNQLAARLEHTENKRRELIADVSHELLTPLTAIKGYMEGLADGVLPAEAATYRQVHKEADRLQRLAADLQELSRVEAGAIRLKKRPISLRSVVAAAKARLSAQFTKKGIKLKTEVPSSLPKVLADGDRVMQVLLNLLGNALHFTPQGGKVTVTVNKESTALRVSVKDTGVGLAPIHIPLVFDRFYRVDKSRARLGGGSGVGLTVARHLVEAHGGRLTVESLGLGKGSTFSFTLPAA